jgi:signal transduction histidine kinase
MLTGTLHDITEMKEVENELRGAHARLDALTAHLEYAREEERRRLAMDIHDDVGAGLSGLRMSLTLLKRDVAHLPDSGARIDSIDRDLDGIIATVRHLGADLRPPALDALGLVPALEVLAAEWSRRCNCAVELDIDDEAAVDMPPDRSIQVYRIVQEALTNVARHASASFVVITLRVTRDRLVISISDDGRGMGDRARGHHSFGLANMHQRARLLGGVVDF